MPVLDRTQSGDFGQWYERHEGACVSGDLGKRGMEHLAEGGERK